MQAVRRFQFCAGHRVHLHESKCRNMHGHNYVLFAHTTAEQGLDALGRVIDFSVIKQKLGDWIDQYIDHGFIYFEEDEEMKTLFSSKKEHKSYPLSCNPTAENIADHILRDICPGLFEGTGVTVNKIVLWETENCFVEVEL